MNQEQMKKRVGEIAPLQLPPTSAKLRGYKLAFNKYTQNRSKEYDAKMGYPQGSTRVGAANVIVSGNPKDVVEGIVYLLTDAQLKQLDKDEGFSSLNNGNPKGYKRKKIYLADGTQAETYIASIPENDPDQKLLPTRDYILNFLEARHLLSDQYYNKFLTMQVLEDIRAPIVKPKITHENLLFSDNKKSLNTGYPQPAPKPNQP